MGESTRVPWARRFDLLRQGLCCVTMATILLVACVWRRWYSTMLIVAVMCCSFFSLPFYPWLSGCSSFGRRRELVCETAARLESVNSSPRSHDGWCRSARLYNSTSSQQLRTTTAVGEIVHPHLLRTARSSGDIAAPASLGGEMAVMGDRPPRGFLGTIGLQCPSPSTQAQPVNTVPTEVQLQPTVYYNDVVYPERQQRSGWVGWV
ncbi:hypothetical protein A1O1_07975 [Capronia coronata CBS 617.96]|uniref:Uncharacterized protein n=1 Tax=Capronia coronata CBS 617.96 TaxID=1182541 RepID=W9XNY5_9EURO|nr:uncharacterized protein A1O1_07975 [Capronia coronata CBS 617.96]EXJ81908.1 hypothetical protein A1O1_07975 [Capronia coronata CBS 617.96]